LGNELRQQILNEIVSGATPKQCADKYNISAGTIRSWVSRNAAKKKPATQRKKSATKKAKEPAIKIEDVSENLTEKERLFCWRYIHNFNATQAYLWSFKCAYNTAMVEGCKALRKPNIKAEIERLKKLKFEAIQITPDDIIERYMKIAFADMTDFVTFGKKEVPVVTKKGPLVDQNGNSVMQTVSYLDFNEHTEVDGGLICEIKQGKQGMSIKLEDRQKALDWLANYFEMNPADKHRKLYDEERLKIQREELALKSKTGATITDAIKNSQQQIQTLASMINNPHPNRTASDLKDD
jgi:phage terminase small subunit